MKRSSVYDAIKKLNEGEINAPVASIGKASAKQTLSELEKLRQNLLESNDRRIEIIEKNREAVANVAHDLKTPLTVISGYAESLSDGMDDKNYAELIIKKCDEMNSLVLTLVENAKRERDALKEERVLWNAGAFFNEEIKKHTSLIEHKGLTLKIGKIPPVTIRINRVQMSSLVQNIISNAVKFTDKGEIAVRFKKSGRFLKVVFSDTGKGIEKNNLHRVFDKFYMEDASRGRAGNSGLGLYIAKEIAEAHGGGLSVASKVGKGSRFTLCLPVKLEITEKAKFYCNKFDRLHPIFKIAITLLFGFFTCILYRASRFLLNRMPSTFISVLLAVPFGMLIWLIDLASVCISGKISFLAE